MMLKNKDDSLSARKAGTVIALGCMLLLAGCNIPSRADTLPLLEAPSSPVHKDVYERSVREDVYPSGGRGERLIQEPTLKPSSPLQGR
ncbi:hypothetical protein JJQ72_13155 [Paenibacillus sp. F411]|uniref:hypothetical protein n=1 Tax=Paenibacillus sp. F411 TaxID=2820239 RepID=UPI001AAFB604|nr:hypothetical protein [Paenibacillus sp. F411]MBO2944919.1 hypothetical protein [Paenibacillus sp. F411]